MHAAEQPKNQETHSVKHTRGTYTTSRRLYNKREHNVFVFEFILCIFLMELQINVVQQAIEVQYYSGFLLEWEEVLQTSD